MVPETHRRRPQRSVVGVGFSFVLIMAGIVAIGVIALGGVQRDFKTFAEEDSPALDHLIHVDRDLIRAHYAVTSGFASDDVDARAAALEEYRSQLLRTDDRWTRYLGVAHNSDREVALQREYVSARADWLATTEVLAGYLMDGRTGTDPEVVAAVADSERLFPRMRGPVHTLEEDVYEPLVESGIDGSGLDPKVLLILLLGGGIVVGGIAWVFAMRDSMRRGAELRERDRTQVLTAELQEMALAMDHAADCIAIFDSDWILRYRNAAFDQHLQVSGDETLWDLEAGSGDGSSVEQITQILEQGGKWTGMRSWHGSDGHTAELHATIAPVIGDAGINTGYVTILRDLSEQKRLEEQLERRATHDALTGLPNRAALLEMLDDVVASRRSWDPLTAVLFLDLDNFKLVNDSLGHAAGDELLIGIAERLTGALRAGDTVGRLGGDEFLVLCPMVVSPDEAMAIAQRIIEVMDSAFAVTGHDVHATISIGVALHHHDETAGDLLAAADTAVYEAKAHGRNRAEFFDAKLRERAQEELEIANSLKRSLERGGDLVAHYQPIVDLARGEVVGFEALCRWHHPERGLLAAKDFMSIAERHGLEVPVGWSIMREVTAQLARWTADPSIRHPVCTNVNVSARQLRDPTFAAEVTRCLDDSGIAPDLLCIEVTEETIVSDLHATADALATLREIGVKVAIDDFGTGSSSLSYIRSLPVDIVKIDMSFAQTINDGPESAAIVAAVIRMAKALNYKVVAEGIETVEQMATLQALRCDRGQGFLFSAAIPPEDATELLSGARLLDSQGALL